MFIVELDDTHDPGVMVTSSDTQAVAINWLLSINFFGPLTGA